MHNDDDTIGRILTRREALTLIGAISAGGLLGLTRYAPSQAFAALPACVVRPQQTEGPYFVDEMLNRSDIRSDPSDKSIRPGTRLDLAINVSRIASGTCAPFAGVLVDIWQCDHLGAYSDVRDRGASTVGKKFLRGYQVTDASGVARFTTVYPGWYPGRAVHIHFKIRSAPATTPGFEFTSQLYFTDELSDQILAQAPYSTRGNRSTRNSNDGIYRQGGSQLLLNPTKATDGLAASFDIGLS